MGSQLKAALLGLAKRQTKTVKVGDVKITIREAGVAEFGEYGSLLKTDRRRATAMLLAHCVVDEDGNEVFENVDEALPMADSSRTSMKLITAIMELSGIGTKELTSGQADAG